MSSLMDITIPNEFIDDVKLQDVLINLQENNYQEIFDFCIREFSNMNFYDVCNHIICIVQTRIHQIKMFAKLIGDLSEYFKKSINYLPIIEFIPSMFRIFYDLGIISEEKSRNIFNNYQLKNGFTKLSIHFLDFCNFQAPVYSRRLSKYPFYQLVTSNKEIWKEINEFGYPKDSIEYCIKYDDIDRLLALFPKDTSEHPTSVSSSYFDNNLRGDFTTPINLAANYGSIQVFKFFLLNEYSINDEIARFAIIGGNNEILQLVKEKGSVFAPYFQFALDSFHNEIAEWILQQETVSPQSGHECSNIRGFLFNLDLQKNPSIFGNVCRIGISSFVRYLISMNADIMSQRGYRKTPIYSAVEMGHTHFLEDLIRYGIDINANYNRNSYSPLHQAVHNEDIESIIILLQNGADINNPTTNLNQTPIILASRLGNIDILRLLVDNGALINVKTKTGVSALNYAVQNNNISFVKYLLSKGADPNFGDEPPLVSAARKSFNEIASILLESGADINLQDLENNTALSFAKQKQNDKLVEMLLSRNLVNT